MTTITMSFELSDFDGRPTVVSNSVDRDGQDRLRGLFESFNQAYQATLFSDFVERETFSWWASYGVVRATSVEVKVWANEESEEDDFVVLARSQFEDMYADFLEFKEQQKPFTKTYPAATAGQSNS